MLYSRWLVSFTVLSLLMLILLPSCGGNDDEEYTFTPAATATATTAVTATPTPTAIPTLTPTPASTNPVKIGVICAWSGPVAMAGIGIADPNIKLLEKQVKDMGGILRGRMVKFIKYDDGGNVTNAQAGALKLLVDEKVSELAIGGVLPAEWAAVMDFAETNKIFFALVSELEGFSERESHFTVNVNPPMSDAGQVEVDLAIKLLKSKTVGILAEDTVQMRNWIKGEKGLLEAAGIKIVYEEYVPIGTVDFTPHLTKLKYANPDLMMLDNDTTEGSITVAKQMMELGGWGDIKVVSLITQAVGKPGTDDWYILGVWFPGTPYPAAEKYEKEYKAANGSMPTASHVYYYDALLTAIEAIKLAGTDGDLEKIAQAARSGNLEFDTPAGPIHFTEAGQSGLHYKLAHVEGGKLVPITMPE